MWKLEYLRVQLGQVGIYPCPVSTPCHFVTFLQLPPSTLSHCPRSLHSPSFFNSCRISTHFLQISFVLAKDLWEFFHSIVCFWLIHPKYWISCMEKSAENSNCPQKKIVLECKNPLRSYRAVYSCQLILTQILLKDIWPFSGGCPGYKKLLNVNDLLLTRNFVVRIYALFPQIFLDWKAKCADIFTYWMYLLTLIFHLQLSMLCMFLARIFMLGPVLVCQPIVHNCGPSRISHNISLGFPASNLILCWSVSERGEVWGAGAVENCMLLFSWWNLSDVNSFLIHYCKTSSVFWKTRPQVGITSQVFFLKSTYSIHCTGKA